VTVAERVSRVRAGDRRAIAALMRDLDDDRDGARDVLRALQDPGAADLPQGIPFPGGIVVGITGGPGAGKSSLVDALIAHARARHQRVGVVAVDPSSPRGGGAVLGDRVRMQRHATDEGVFIRSVASRGAPGGLSRSAMDVAAVLLAGGFSRILVETVGVGQSEVDVAAAADVTVVVMTPGLGDDIQTLKAGILEIADVLVLNKSDRPGAEAALRDLQAMLSLRHASAPWSALAESGAEPGAGSASGFASASDSRPPADVPIIKTVALTGQGVDELVAAIDGVVGARTLVPEGQRRRRRAEARIRAVVMARTEAAIRGALAPGGSGASLADDVAALKLDPETAANVLMTHLRGGY
jgi:LAO/AO transport system kinase